MEHLVLFAGGVLYLLNKLLFVCMEEQRGLDDEESWFCKKLAWSAYLLGLPFAVGMIFVERGLPFSLIEIGGMPAMICGFISASRRGPAPRWLGLIALAVIPAGLTISYNHDDGTTFNRLLDFGGSAGFLIGIYLLSKDRPSGYLWFMLMNVTTVFLLFRQGYWWSVLQPILSFWFVSDAYRLRLNYDGWVRRSMDPDKTLIKKDKRKKKPSRKALRKQARKARRVNKSK